MWENGLNAAYFADSPLSEPDTDSPNFHVLWDRPAFDRALPADFRPLRVAIVGMRPAGMYTARDLLLHTNAELTLIDRLRHGVPAPIEALSATPAPPAAHPGAAPRRPAPRPQSPQAPGR